MIKCNKDCTVICDFCRYFKPHDEELEENEGFGICILTQKEVDPTDSCEDFHCLLEGK